ncbi:phosphate-starvation-inducible PsiE family protein [Methanomethylovorans sp.]|uniref:phosphate-starvation-inducible PsiE family protein n=1 Tax=Methanomethylovorans sp. TaxID=2758717 RepID=UPI00351C768B
MELHDKIYKKVIYNVTVVVLYILLLLIIVGVFDIFQTMWAVLMKTSNINDVVYNVLTIFVLIDLFKTFSDYRVQERIRITYVTDATILILMREITVMVYSHDFEIYVLLAFAALLLVLCIMRFISMNYHPTDNSVSLIKKKDTEDE